MHHLARIPQQAPASTLTAGVGTGTPVTGYKGGLDIFVVGNEAAVQGLNARSMRALLNELGTAGAIGLPKKHLRARDDDNSAVVSRRPYPNKVTQTLKRMAASPPPDMMHSNSARIPEPVSLQRTLGELFPARKPLRFDTEQIIWTDGSCIKPEVGDGPNRLGAAAYNGRTGETLYVDPAGNECTNTIQRAELAAIRAALAKFMDTPSQLTIATDSQSATYSPYKESCKFTYLEAQSDPREYRGTTVRMRQQEH